MEITQRIYNTYTDTLSRILDAAGSSPLSRTELYAVAQNSMDMIGTSFLPVLLACAKHTSLSTDDKSPSPEALPIDHLYLSWIKTILADTRVRLLIPHDVLDTVQRDLLHISSLFKTSELEAFRPAGGDPFHDAAYLELMQTLVHSQQNHHILRIQYRGAEDRLPGCYQPLQFQYTPSADQFLVRIQRIESGSVISALTINVTDITEARIANDNELTSESSSAIHQTLFDDYLLLPPREPLILEISGGRHVLERCRHTFAAFDKRIEYDQASRTCICWLSYKSSDEDNLITCLLELDASNRVISPPAIACKLRAKRLQRQGLRIYNY